MVKNPPANAGDMGSISEWGRSPGEADGNSSQYSCLGNSTDRGAWRATVYGVTKSRTRLKQLSMHSHTDYVVLVLGHLYSTKQSFFLGSDAI